MGKKNTRYCVRTNTRGLWQIWDRKMSKWWGKPSKEFPGKMIDLLNSGKKPKKY